MTPAYSIVIFTYIIALRISAIILLMRGMLYGNLAVLFQDAKSLLYRNIHTQSEKFSIDRAMTQRQACGREHLRLFTESEQGTFALDQKFLSDRVANIHHALNSRSTIGISFSSGDIVDNINHVFCWRKGKNEDTAGFETVQVFFTALDMMFRQQSMFEQLEAEGRLENTQGFLDNFRTNLASFKTLVVTLIEKIREAKANDFEEFLSSLIADAKRLGKEWADSIKPPDGNTTPWASINQQQDTSEHWDAFRANLHHPA